MITVKEALATILDAVDYTNGACSLTEMVGAVLPEILITNARQALAGLDTPSKPEEGHTIISPMGGGDDEIFIPSKPPICEQCGSEMTLLQHPMKPPGVACGHICLKCDPPSKPACETCGGSGWLDRNEHSDPCPDCNGTGKEGGSDGLE